MTAYLYAVAAALARQRALKLALAIVCGAALTSVRASPAYSPVKAHTLGSGESAELKCRPTLDVPSYLNSDQKMQLETGNWGTSVHPQVPHFFRFEHEKEGEAASAARRSGGARPTKCRRHSASDDRDAV